MPDVVTVVLTGISLVFFILLLLTAIIFVFGKIMGGDKKKSESVAVAKPEVIAPKTVEPVLAVTPVAEPVSDDLEIIAVIAAAVAAMGGGTVVSVKQSAGSVRGGGNFNGWKQSAVNSYVRQI